MTDKRCETWIEQETCSFVGPVCPYCGYEVTADEAMYYREDYEADECDGCGKTFDISVAHSVSWTCSPTLEHTPHKQEK